MFDLLPTDKLEGAGSALGTLLATWLAWPILCGYIGATKGELKRGMMHGLFWGPIGLVFVLLMDRKYACPTCGQKTLKQPAVPDARRADPVLNVELPPIGPAAPIKPPTPTATPERRAAAPMSKEERERIVAAACAGYDAEEAARLRSWLNNEELRS